MPRFSIKQLLLLVGAFSLVSIILAMASRGSLVAYGLAVSFVLMSVSALSMAFFYVIARSIPNSKKHLSQTFESPSFGPDRLEDQG